MYVEVEPERQPSEEPPTDTRPNVQQVLGVGVPAVTSPFTSIPEEAEVVDPVVSQPMETESLTRTRQPESEPGCEFGARNVRPRAGSEVSERHVNGDEEPPPTTTKVDALPGAAASTVSFGRPSSETDPPDVSMNNSSQAVVHCQISASTYLTVFPRETGFDSLAQAIVHGSDDALLDPEPNTFEADEGMAVFDNGTKSFWVSPKPQDKGGVLYDELTSENKKKFDAARSKEIDNLLKLGALSVMISKTASTSAKQRLRTSYRRTCWTSGNDKTKAR